MNITPQAPSSPARFALFALGFRPFFTAAALFAVLSIAIWTALFTFGVALSAPVMGGILWHAHAMVFGYAMAVIAGFLLTAVGNWTGVPGLRGAPLAALLVAWLSARVLTFVPWEHALILAAAADGLFILGLIAAVLGPVLKVRQWAQTGIIAKLVLMGAANIAFYTGAADYLNDGGRTGVFAGLYLILALVFTMARRVLPPFTSNGVDGPYEARNRRWVDVSSLVLFLAWALLDLFTPWTTVGAVLSALLAVVHAIRLRDWYTVGIWRKPLLWVLHLGYAFLVLGFALKALAGLGLATQSLALHAFTFGGLGLMTLGMMARVSLGHTGRNVFAPPAVLNPMFSTLALGAVIRVFGPWLLPGQYMLWIGLSQALWIIAFSGFLVIYLPVLAKPRVDGKPG
ncbi:MAG: NnrS family protein [Gammaproteobacteria bacterium]